MDVGFLLWAGALLAGLVILAVLLGSLAARLFLDASRNGTKAPPAPEARGRESDAKSR